MHRKSESPFALRLAGRKYPSSKPCGSVGGVDRLVKARPLGWPSASLDQPPATACLMPVARADPGTVNSHHRDAQRSDELLSVAGGLTPHPIRHAHKKRWPTPVTRAPPPVMESIIIQ